jgi:16S rRNA (cytosine967-C5)-methyltransferase
MIGVRMGNSPPYDPVRLLAWKILQEIERSSSFADLTLDQAFFQSPDLRALDRAMISEMVLGTLRWQGRLDVHLRQGLKSKDKKIEPRLIHLLRLGAYQILFMDRVPESAAVNESVRLAKILFKNEKITGFVNALLRSVIRNKNQELFPPFGAHPVEHITQAFSHPSWLVERWVKEFGPDAARRICAANNQKPPFTIRANTLKISREELQTKLEEAGSPSQPAPFSPEGLFLKKSPALAEDRLFQGGIYFVQDEASQLIPHFLSPQPGERVLDVCAAPGGKTTHIAQLMENRGEIIALELHGPKVKLIEENCRRLGITAVRALEVDAARPLPFPAGMVFDRILVDAPCTGLGILHRNPEARWRRKPEDVIRLSRVQGTLLDNVSSWLKPGGALVYSTCTITPEENDGVINAFLQKRPEFRLEDLRDFTPAPIHPLVDPKGFFRTYPDGVTAETNRMDGFFAARLAKK